MIRSVLVYCIYRYRKIQELQVENYISFHFYQSFLRTRFPVDFISRQQDFDKHPNVKKHKQQTRRNAKNHSMISRIIAKQASKGRRSGVLAGRHQYGRTSGSLGLRSKHTVSLQLDYYMSTQFAGIACAMVDGLYDKAGIDLQFLPICPVGLEMECVRQHRNASASTDEVVVGRLLLPCFGLRPCAWPLSARVETIAESRS